MSVATRHVPMRRCVRCRTSAPKPTLERFVRNGEGVWHLDPAKTTPGRGAWICTECIQLVNERDLRRAFHGSAVHLATELAGRASTQPTREA